MAAENKYQQQPQYPLAPARITPRSDEESATVQSKELKKKKRIKLALYIVAFVIFQTAVIAAFMQTVMKVKTPKVRFGTVTVEEMTTTGTANRSTPSFKATFSAQFTVKNKNFGQYKFDANTVTFAYGGVTVGSVVVPAGKAGMMSTKKVDVTVTVDSSALTSTAELGAELGSNLLTLTSKTKLSGKVRLLMVLKKKKAAEMDCTLIFNVSDKTVQNLKCK